MARRYCYTPLEWLVMARESSYEAARMAANFKVSGRQLQRLSRQLFGRSPQAWLDEMRLTAACGSLAELRCVKAVAYELGFKQPSHFSRQFKRRFGLSPRAYLERVDSARGGGSRTAAGANSAGSRPFC